MKIQTALLFSSLLVVTTSCKPRESAQSDAPSPTTAPSTSPGSTPTPESPPPSPETNARNEAKIATWTQDAPPPPSQKIYSRFLQAIHSNDITAAEAIASEAEISDPSSPFNSIIRADLLLAHKNWTQINSLLTSAPSPASHSIIRTISSRLAFRAACADAPASLIAQAAQSFAQSVSENPHTTPMDWLALSTLQFKSGNPDAAQSSARSAVEAAKKIPAGHSMPTSLYEKFADQIDQGKLPSIDDITLWSNETLPSPDNP